MSATTPRDLNGLVSPIDGPSPTGLDPRIDPTAMPDFQTLRDARSEARRIERQAADLGMEPVEARAQWRTISELAQKILSTHAKDLEAACYLLEAWVRLDGFEGLRSGMTLLRALVEQYWEGLYPQPEDGEGPAARARYIDRLSGPLPEALCRVSITAGSTSGPFATWEYQQSAALSSYTDRDREERIRRGAITLETIERAAAETDVQFFKKVLTDLDGSLEELRTLDAALLEHCGSTDAPATSVIVEAIEQIQAAIRNLAGDRIVPEPSADEEGSAGEGSPAGVAGGGGSMGPLRTREDAFRALVQVAEFFERMDPQSLLAAHIRRILRLGKMSPVEYFTEIVEDEGARSRLFKLLGLTPPPE